jgi:hypothetical protein
MDGPARASWRVSRSPNRAYVLGFAFLHGRQQGGMCGRFTNRLTLEGVVRLYRLTIQLPHDLPPRRPWAAAGWLL